MSVSDPVRARAARLCDLQGVARVQPSDSLQRPLNVAHRHVRFRPTGRAYHPRVCQHCMSETLTPDAHWALCRGQACIGIFQQLTLLYHLTQQGVRVPNRGNRPRQSPSPSSVLAARP